MKNGWKINRVKLIACVLGVASVLVLGGFSLYNPVLINANEPFINLTEGKRMGLSDAVSAKKESEPEQHTPAVVQPTVKKELTVEITGGTMQVDGVNCLRISDLEGILKKQDNLSKKVIIVDNYANYVLYRRVLGAVKNAGYSFAERREE